MEKYYIIYETKNLKNGKIYIGMHVTDDLEDGYLGSGKRLKRAIRYYGREFFEKRILHVFDNREDMVTKEIELVNEDFVEREDTYNLRVGGDGCFKCNNHREKFINAGIENGKLMRPRVDELLDDPEWREMYSDSIKRGLNNFYSNGGENGFKGKTHSEETKAKMRNARKGKQSGSKNSQYGSRWITNKIENRKIGKDEPIPEGWFLGRKIK